KSISASIPCASLEADTSNYQQKIRKKVKISLTSRLSPTINLEEKADFWPLFPKPFPNLTEFWECLRYQKKRPQVWGRCNRYQKYVCKNLRLQQGQMA
ncbi:MAG: hypothetical protein LBD96_02730, partial [Treponema sp.]|nr:hypothetical protein [Treponema sp.]